jgi:hypothetical protein
LVVRLGGAGEVARGLRQTFPELSFVWEKGKGGNAEREGLLYEY